MVMDEPFIFALRNRASGLILVAGYAGHARRGDPRRDDNMRRAAFPYALWVEDEMFWRCSRRRPARRTRRGRIAAKPPIRIARSPDARRCWRAARQRARQTANAYVNRGYAYSTVDYDRAIKDYDEAIRLDSKAERTYNARGRAYVMKGDYDRAIEDLDEAIRLYPQYALAYTSRGKVYHGKGDNDRAIRDHDEAIRLDPKFVVAYFNRGFGITNH